MDNGTPPFESPAVVIASFYIIHLFFLNYHLESPHTSTFKEQNKRNKSDDGERRPKGPFQVPGWARPEADRELCIKR